MLTRETLTNMAKVMLAGSPTLAGAFWLGVLWERSEPFQPPEPPPIVGSHQMPRATVSQWRAQAEENGYGRIRGSVEATMLDVDDEHFGHVYFANFGEPRLQNHGLEMK